MRKIIFIIAMLISNISLSQCVINGPNQFEVGQTVNFSVQAGIAQCIDCYDWDINNSDLTISGNLQIIGTDQNNSVQINAINTGNFSIKLTYFDETGCHFCVFDGKINPRSIDCSCIPNFDSYYVCNTNEKGQIFNVLNSCSNSNSISSIFIRLSCGTFTNGPLSGQAFGLINSPFSNFSLINDGLKFANCNCQNNYSITITYNYNNGCPSKTIKKMFQYDITNDILLKSSNLIELIKVYPNPTKNVINFKGEKLENYFISIFDEKGNNVIKDHNINDSLNIEKINKGTYIYTISNYKDYKQDGKIIKD